MKVKRLTSLILIELDQHYRITKNKYLIKRNKSDLFSFVAILSAIIAMILIYSPIYLKMLEANLEVYITLNIQSFFLANFIILSGFFGFFLGTFIMIGEFYFNKDMKLLITLPLKPYETIIGKVSVVLADQMIISIILLLTPMIYFGINTNQNFLYYVIVSVVFLFSQILPVTVVLLYTFLISHLFKKINKKEILMYLLTILLITVVAVYIFFMGNIFSVNIENSQELPAVLINPDSLISKIFWIYPTAFFAIKAFSSFGIAKFLWLLIFICFHFFLFFLVIYFGKKFFYSAYSNLIQVKPNNKKVKSFNFNKRYSQDKSLLKREWQYFLKTPSFSFNGFSNVLVFPILFIVFSIIFKNVDLGLTQEGLETLFHYKIFIVALIASLSSSLNGLSYSCFSREGKFIKELKVLPVKTKQILKAKIIHIFQLGFIGHITGLIVGSIFFRLNLYEFFGALILSTTLSVFLNIIQMVIDALRPYLDWDNPQKAMKQNINGLFSVLIIFGTFGLLSFLIYKLVPIFGQTICLVIFSIIFLILTLSFSKILIRKTENLFSKDL